MSAEPEAATADVARLADIRRRVDRFGASNWSESDIHWLLAEHNRLEQENARLRAALTKVVAHDL